MKSGQWHWIDAKHPAPANAHRDKPGGRILGIFQGGDSHVQGVHVAPHFELVDTDTGGPCYCVPGSQGYVARPSGRVVEVVPVDDPAIAELPLFQRVQLKLVAPVSAHDSRMDLNSEYELLPAARRTGSKAERLAAARSRS